MAGPGHARVLIQGGQETDVRRLDRLRQLCEEVERSLDRHLPPVGDIAFIDFPLNPNVGNHLMWLAVMRYLRSRRRRVGYVAHYNNYRHAALRRAVGDGPVLIIGGAGMGGLWPRVRELRHRVISDCHDNPVVILPQTVMFRDEAERAESQAVVNAHPRLTVMARDQVSLETSVRAYPNANVVLVPDLAFLLPPQSRRRAAPQAVCWLARVDVEATTAKPPLGIFPFDWADLSPREWLLGYVLMRTSGVFSRIRLRFSTGPLHDASGRALVWFYERVAQALLGCGNKLADRGTVFVTDRMHGHVLAVLRGQPTVLLPDAFGKNRAIYESWTQQFLNVTWADSPVEALAAVARFLSA
jgi:pyruvyl transferase EpsO